VEKFKKLRLKKSLSVSSVNIEEKKRSNLFSWRGQFSPQLIEEILVNYSSESDIVFDPFLGSGTVLFECVQLGIEASGCEINPAAISFSRIYELANKEKNEIATSIKNIDAFVSKYTSTIDLNIERFKKALLGELEISSSVISEIILKAFITGLDFEAKKTDQKRIIKVWNGLCRIIQELPFSNKKITSYEKDARNSSLKDDSIDFVLTSPPYINVFNYHQNYRKSIEFTGVDVLKVAKSEIGANRKFRQNRFLTVVQYCMDMYQVFLELNRVCRKNAKIIFIVGRESNVRKTSFKNADLIISVAQIACFQLEAQQERVFKNKFGESIFEEILKFTIMKKNSVNKLCEVREVGKIALKNALSYAEENVLSDILDAIQKSDKIDPSPILEK